MRQLAWLNTAPKGGSVDSTASESRAQRLRNDGHPLPLPPLERARYLVDYLLEAGPTQDAMNGVAPLSWLELRAWQSQVGVELQPWEARTLRTLSIEYAAEKHRARAPDSQAPWQPPPTPDSRAAVAAHIRSVFGALARKGKPS